MFLSMRKIGGDRGLPLQKNILTSSVRFHQRTSHLPRKEVKELTSEVKEVTSSLTPSSLDIMSIAASHLQGDQLYRAVLILYLVISYLSSDVRYCSRVHRTSHFLQGTRITCPCLSGRVLAEGDELLSCNPRLTRDEYFS